MFLLGYNFFSFVQVIRVAIPTHNTIIIVAEQITAMHNLCCVFVYCVFVYLFISICESSSYNF